MTTTYNDTTPLNLPATIDATGNLVAIDAEDLLSYAFQPTIIVTSVVPPATWSLSRIVWADGSGGNLPVPAPGLETTHSFSYTISKGTQTKSGGGFVKLKHAPPS